MNLEGHEIGIGATELLSLRVSVGVLVRLIFENPATGDLMLALERTATLLNIEDRQEVIVKTKPFGGGVRLINPQQLKERIGTFHYDSIRSRQEGDFRILVIPDSWHEIKKICREHAKENKADILDSSPERELAEEFEDSLKIKLASQQYDLKPGKLVIEDLPVKTANIYAQGFPTVRVYYIFEARIKSPEILEMILQNSDDHSDGDLRKMAEEDAKLGGKGRANAILAVSLDKIVSFYNSLPLEERKKPQRVGGHLLDGNVPAILELTDDPK